MHSDNMANLLDALTETSVYVIEEETHRLLYFNRRCADTGEGKAVLGEKCHEVWPDLCANCPLASVKDKTSGHIVSYNPLLGATVDTTANRISWDGHIPSFVITMTPHKMNFEETQGSKKIKEMYAKSLVTVFEECIIANLTADYYVNCQKDLLWSNIPEQGKFGWENQKYARNVLHPDDLEEFNNYFSREAMLRLFLEGKKQITRRMRRMIAAGSYHMVEFTAAKINVDADGDCWCALVFRDIQDEFLAEQQRDVEVSQLAVAAEIAYQMLISVNLTENTYHMLEYKRAQVSKPGTAGCFNDLIKAELATVHPDYQEEFVRKFTRYFLKKAFNSGERIISMKVPHLGADGIYHWYFTQVVRVESSYTDDLIEITLSRNIDEEKRQQQEVVEKERRSKQLLGDALQKAENANRAKSDFLSRMSHDIRTPMNAILGMTELALLNLGDGEKLEDYLKKISGSGLHLLGLINEVLDVSKIESGNMQLEDTAFDLCDLLREVKELIQISVDKRRQTLRIEIDDSVQTRVSGDVQRLKQILVNILDNASKYTPEGGRISLCLQELDNSAPKAGTYRFVIEDNGIGMEPEYLKHVFEPFSRAADSRISKVTGTGLGMTIVKNLISIMGGDIRVESESGRGTRFSITLCLEKNDAKAPADLPKEKQEAPDFGRLRILLVEDNELNRQIATEMIQLLGAQVETAEDGQQAVDKVSFRPPFYYDLVFMDVQMPKMNGYDATKEIRNLGMEGIEDLPIIAMTADAFAEDVKRARLAGMNGHLAKPISMEQLKKVLFDSLPRRQECETDR